MEFICIYIFSESDKNIFHKCFYFGFNIKNVNVLPKLDICNTMIMLVFISPQKNDFYFGKVTYLSDRSLIMSELINSNILSVLLAFCCTTILYKTTATAVIITAKSNLFCKGIAGAFGFSLLCMYFIGVECLFF